MRTNENERAILRALLTEGYTVIHYQDKLMKDDRKIQAAINIVKDTNAAGYIVSRQATQDSIRLHTLGKFDAEANSRALAQLTHYLAY